jgi:hypothetical protein
MGRLEAAAAWFFTNLGILLLVASILVVPDNLFADSGSDCVTSCQSNPYYYNCIAACCQSKCLPPGAEPCTNDCCKSACGTDVNCFTNCSTFAIGCENGLDYCKGFGTQALCETKPNDCWMTLKDCQCLWNNNDTAPKCKCRVP